MNDSYKYLLIENESEFKSSLLKDIKCIYDLKSLLKYLDRLISIQYYKGLFYDSSEYDEILSDKIESIINNTFDEIKENSSCLNPECFNYDESEYKYYIESLLESYDIFISGLKYKTNINQDMKIKSVYLINLYLENDSIENPDYFNELIAYESESDYYDYIDEMISCFLNNSSNKDNMIFRYFNYDEYKSDEISNDELYEIEINNKKSYIHDYNQL